MTYSRLFTSHGNHTATRVIPAGSNWNGQIRSDELQRDDAKLSGASDVDVVKDAWERYLCSEISHSENIQRRNLVD